MQKKLFTNAVEAGLKEMNPAVPNRLIFKIFENSIYHLKIFKVCGAGSCFHGGQCAASGLICECPAGWEGDRCERDKNECALSNGGCSHQCCNLARVKNTI